MSTPTGGETSPSPSASKALLIYNAARLLLLVVFLGLGYVAGLRSFALIVVALLLSGIVSWFLLRSQRIRAGMAVEQAITASRTAQTVAAPVRKKRAGFRARVAAEDAYVDEMQAQQAKQNDGSADHASR